MSANNRQRLKQGAQQIREAQKEGRHQEGAAGAKGVWADAQGSQQGPPEAGSE